MWELQSREAFHSGDRFLISQYQVGYPFAIGVCRRVWERRGLEPPTGSTLSLTDRTDGICSCEDAKGGGERGK